ncbi:FHA domain-containing serine/threonine-protein kinase [Micromonospora sp. NPDC002296]|uniref:FHA domain-containing serine/threonine-protein kinase n=1 Tax=Micromonospora sp. NPDC002296 TaxID=3154271 RepID=UPI00332B0750
MTVTVGASTETHAFDSRATALVGRAPACRIRVDDEQRRISRYHCLLDVNPPSARVRDLGSRNGTYVNGELIDGEQDLRHGDEIRVGRARLRITVADDRPATVAAPAGADPGDALPALLAAAAASAPDLSDFRDHRVLHELGRGGQSVVYLARHEPSGRLVALKTLLADRAVDPAARDGFLREFACVRALRHSKVVAFHSSGSAGTAFFFTCEYCAGGSVADLVARRGGRLTVDEAVPIVLDALAGLAYAHRVALPVTLADGRATVSRGLVHRDIKPSNLLLAAGADGGTVTKVADFGLAKAFDQAGLSGHTRTGAIGGSIAFQARAQLIDYKYARPEVDLWALTACLYWMLTGATPRDFPPATDPIAVVLRTRPVPVRQRLASVPPRLARVIDEMLVDHPRVAAATAGDLADAFRQAL